MLPRAVLSLILILAMAAAWAVPALADTVYPKATDRIADDAAILSESTVREIKEKNETLISEVEAAIAVCTVKTTNGVDIGKYARSIYTEWKLPAGVLILIASEDNAFYLVQSASISDKITNEDLEAIRDREIEEDFAAGNVDRAVRKAVSQLSILMLKELKPEEGEEGAPQSGEVAELSEQEGTEEATTGAETLENPSEGDVLAEGETPQAAEDVQSADDAAASGGDIDGLENAVLDDAFSSSETDEEKEEPPAFAPMTADNLESVSVPEEN